MLNGKPHGCAWKAWPGGSFLFRPNVNVVDGIFIYPDLETAFVGSFEGQHGHTMTKAFEAQVQDFYINAYGFMEPRCLILEPKQGKRVPSPCPVSS